MSLDTADKEISWSDDIWESTDIKALREQQETDFGNWGPYEYKMPQGEGKWDTMTTNSPKIYANKLIGLVSSARRMLFIDVDDEEKKPNQSGRNKISDTERLANGAIWANDRELTSAPSGKTTQDSLGSFAVLRGGTVKSLLWTENKDEQPKCIIRTYDPMFCQWEEGDREIIKFCYRNFVSESFIKRAYKEQIKKGVSFGEPVTGRKGYLSYTFFDEDEWKVAINGYYVDEGEHGLGYVPVNIRSCGAVPYLHSIEYQDTMKFSWQSYAINTREVYDLMSKLLSIAKTKAVDSGRKDIIAYYNSGNNPDDKPEIEKLGYGTGQRNNVLFLDTAKGHEFKGILDAQGNEIIDSFYNRVRGEMDVLGTMDPIASGVMDRSGSGALADILTKNALQSAEQYFKCVENDLIWLAEESVRQFKGGQYEKTEVEGRDIKGKKFSIKLSPSDVVEKHFDCKLVADRLRDRTLELGNAINEVKNGLSSVKSAMQNHNLHEDPDREMELIENEKHLALASGDPVEHHKGLANHYIDEGNEEMALYHLQLAKIAIEATIEGMMGATNPAGRNGSGQAPPGTPLSPQAQSSGMGAESLRVGGIGV